MKEEKEIFLVENKDDKFKDKGSESDTSIFKTLQDITKEGKFPKEKKENVLKIIKEELNLNLEIKENKIINNKIEENKNKNNNNVINNNVINNSNLNLNLNENEKEKIKKNKFSFSDIKIFYWRLANIEEDLFKNIIVYDFDGNNNLLISLFENCSKQIREKSIHFLFFLYLFYFFYFKKLFFFNYF